MQISKCNAISGYANKLKKERKEKGKRQTGV
jgi:hypothetical protein